jgi:hypothetical protein
MIINNLKLLFAVVVPVVMTCGPVIAQSILYSQSVVTTAGGGAGGADFSRQQGTTAREHRVTGGYRLASDFSLTTNASIASIVFQGTLANSGTTTSPFSGISAKIWSARPGTAGASVLASSTTLGSNTFANLYQGTNSAATNRPVFDVEATFSGANLSAGTYWLDVGLLDTAGFGYAPTTAGQIGEPSIQYDPGTGGWTEVKNLSTESPRRVIGPAEFGFKVNGTSNPSANVAPEPAALSLFIFGLPVVLMSLRKVSRSKAH